jgi:hypothetical protein
MTILNPSKQGYKVWYPPSSGLRSLGLTGVCASFDLIPFLFPAHFLTLNVALLLLVGVMS